MKYWTGMDRLTKVNFIRYLQRGIPKEAALKLAELLDVVVFTEDEAEKAAEIISIVNDYAIDKKIILLVTKELTGEYMDFTAAGGSEARKEAEPVGIPAPQAEPLISRENEPKEVPEKAPFGWFIDEDEPRPPKGWRKRILSFRMPL